MIRLHPLPDVALDCPRCHVRLDILGWHIPGMRNLADLQCPICARKFYGDLPAGQGLYTPVLLDTATGDVFDNEQSPWFSGWLKSSYAYRSAERVSLEVEEFRPIRRPILLNCLDRLYGHCLLKLLNAQYYLDHCPDFDLIVLVPRLLRWMVPTGVAAIWTLVRSLERGLEWHDSLAAEIHQRLEAAPEAWLSVGLSHPSAAEYTIERFTGVAPFPLDEWSTRRPIVSFIWREDRGWWPTQPAPFADKVSRQLKYGTYWPHHLQQAKVIDLAERLREQLPTLEFRVVGLGEAGGLPGWITDHRLPRPDDATERVWCQLYAESQAVVGVHGSNMLLPSGHAGSVIDLMPGDRWANRFQDILLDRASLLDSRLALCRSTLLPVESTAAVVAQVVATTMTRVPLMRLNFAHEWATHSLIQQQPFLLAQQRLQQTRR